MFEAAGSPYLVSYSDEFGIASARTTPPAGTTLDESRSNLKRLKKQLSDLQRRLYAQNKFAVLLVFQAMDAAGKDSTIRSVLTGVNPAGFQVFSFKQPSPEELDHDFLWRTARRLPERGRIGVFNRSYYEEVLVVRVHPEYLGSQNLPYPPDGDRLWLQRYASIREHEKHLARAGVVILKFWLNVSKNEQKNRFLARIDEPRKNWKFSESDVRERGYWNDYMEAYEDTLNATSRPWAPWYAIPADDKPYMRAAVAEIVVRNLAQLRPDYPRLSVEQEAALGLMREHLENE
ncbi:MAG: PPK2 family polyphosphate kinase [Gemmatimonadota bacterium]